MMRMVLVTRESDESPLPPAPSSPRLPSENLTISQIYQKFVLYFGLSAPVTRRFWHQSISAQKSVDILQATHRPSFFLSESPAVVNNSLSGIYTGDISREPDEYFLQKQRARQNIQRQKPHHGSSRTASMGVIGPNLSVCSKEYVEKKTHRSHRPGRLLPPSEVRLGLVLPEGLNSNILTGHQILNATKDLNRQGNEKDSSVGVEKNDRTTHFPADVNGESQQQRQQSLLQQNMLGGTDECSSWSRSSRVQMPAILPKKFLARTNLPAGLSTSMPSIKVPQKPADPRYADPMVNCPVGFHQRIAELVLLETDTIRWEKSKKTKKKRQQPTNYD